MRLKPISKRYMRHIVAKTILTCTLGLSCWTWSGAQTFLDKGKFSASLETNNVVYVNDEAIGAEAPEDRFGSNTYLKMDYGIGKFSAGLQIETYLPALYGFELGQQPDPKKFFLGSKYVRWSADSFTIHVGDIYDQFGNGLVFRSYEDRNLGFNNALEGVYAAFNLNNWFTLKGMYGRPRLYTDHAGSWVRGADLNISFGDIFKWDSIVLDLEGSYVNRYESLDKPSDYLFSEMGVTSPNVHLFSGALNFGWNGLSLKAEYAAKSKDLCAFTQPNATKGAAIFAEINYAVKTFSASGTFRLVDHMGTMLSLYGNGTGNTLNYIPALSRQYHYLLANLEPHQVNLVGECAGQADLYYTLRSKSSRSKYWIFHANFSTAWTISKNQTDDGSRRMTWMDINADAECHWMKSLKTTFLYSRQEYSPDHGFIPGTIASNIFVADVQYKFNKTYALRGELQYLFAKARGYEEGMTPVKYEGDWVAALLEFSIAPQWNVYASEMYNFGKNQHYYNAGVSWAKGRTRVQVSYGRNRAGYVCSGGVCRYSPAYTGLNVLLTAVF